MTTKLLSTQQTAKVERLVRKAATAQFGHGRAKPIFEHDHWWVVVEDENEDEVFYDVVDSDPSVAYTGLSFERL